MSPLELFLEHAGGLVGCYWRIRMARGNKRRNWYRKAAKEKGHLLALGYCPEVIRLYALYLRDLKRPNRYDRFCKAFQDSLTRPPDPVQLKLF